MAHPGEAAVLGIHHITAIAGDPQANVAFYTTVLGLRLVKRTVNFDDPGTYHLYYGDTLGRPGTILTFFPWPGAPRGRRGTGQATATAFSVPSGALEYWTQRLARHEVPYSEPAHRFDEEFIQFTDRDGMLLELVASETADPREPWAAGPIPDEHAIRGFFTTTLKPHGADVTVALLQEAMGFRPIGEAPDRVRLSLGGGAPGARVDVALSRDARPGHVAVGSVHHVALRVADDAAQGAWRERLLARGHHVTPVVDRTYFRSIYFREPGGVLFELATDAPGFTVDEAAEALGSELKLPPWLEASRSRIEATLPPLSPPAAQ